MEKIENKEVEKDHYEPWIAKSLYFTWTSQEGGGQ